MRCEEWTGSEAPSVVALLCTSQRPLSLLWARPPVLPPSPAQISLEDGISKEVPFTEDNLHVLYVLAHNTHPRPSHPHGGTALRSARP